MRHYEFLIVSVGEETETENFVPQSGSFTDSRHTCFLFCFVVIHRRDASGLSHMLVSIIGADCVG